MDLSSARKEVEAYQHKGIPLAEVIWECSPVSSSTARDYRSLFDKRTLFDFTAYKNAVTALEWSNREKDHTTDATEVKQLRQRFDALIASEFDDVDEEQFSFRFTGMTASKNSHVTTCLEQYHGPSVMVSAGFHYHLHVPDALSYFKRMLRAFGDLSSGFSVNYYDGRPTAQLLGGVISVSPIPHLPAIFVQGYGSQWKTLQGEFTPCEIPRYWRGKASNFANFIDVMSKALRDLPGEPVLLYDTGPMCRGLDIVLYTTPPCHESADVWPKELIGKIQSHSNGKTQIYAGNEIDLEVKVVPDNSKGVSLLDRLHLLGY